MNGRLAVAVLLPYALLPFVLARDAGAQRARAAERHTVTEVRLDGYAGRAAGALLGVGLVLDAGSYTRLALDVAAGAERTERGGYVGAQQVEGVARFHGDPFRQSRHGVYGGGGVAVRRSAGHRLRPLLVGLLGIEGPSRRGVAAAVEGGLGGGARIGLVLRGARSGSR